MSIVMQSFGNGRYEYSLGVGHATYGENKNQERKKSVQLGRAGAAMTQGPGGRAPPVPPAPGGAHRLLRAAAAHAAVEARGPLRLPAGGAGAADLEPEPAGLAGVPARLRAALRGALSAACSQPLPGRWGTGAAGHVGVGRDPRRRRRRVDAQRQLHPQAGARLATPRRQGPGSWGLLHRAVHGLHRSPPLHALPGLQHSHPGHQGSHHPTP